MDVLIVLGTTAAWGYGLALIGVGYEAVGHDGEMMITEDMYRM